MINLARKIESKIGACLHWFLPEQFELDSSSSESIREYHRYLLMVSITLLALVGLFPVQLFRSIVTPDQVDLIYSVPFAMLLGTVFLFDLKKNKKVRLFYFFVFGGFFILIPFKIYSLGVSSWPVLFWSFVLYISSSKVVNVWACMIGLASHAFMILYFYTIGFQGEFNIFDKNVVFLSTTSGLLTLLAFEMIHYRIKLRIRSFKMVQEKNKNLKRLITSLNHEINNPLMIAMGSLDHYMVKKDPHLLERVSAALDRISEILKTIRSIEDFETTSYLEGSEMIRLDIPSSEKKNNTQQKNLLHEINIKKKETQISLQKYQKELEELLNEN